MRYESIGLAVTVMLQDGGLLEGVTTGAGTLGIELQCDDDEAGVLTFFPWTSIRYLEYRGPEASA